VNTGISSRTAALITGGQGAMIVYGYTLSKSRLSGRHVRPGSRKLRAVTGKL
jgi:hypothetical protein